MSSKKLDNRFAIGFLCVLTIIVLLIPTPGNRTWAFNDAIQTEPRPTLVARRLHFLRAPGDPYSIDAKVVEMTLEGKGGKLTLTDETNGVIYEGWYFRLPWQRGVYMIRIDGKGGYANVTMGAPSMLTMVVDGYVLRFMVD
jgi:hypothetical protein